MKKIKIKKEKKIRVQPEDPDIVSSSSEDEEEDLNMQYDNAEDADKARRLANKARRIKEAQMRKRPMVAGQRYVLE